MYCIISWHNHQSLWASKIYLFHYTLVLESVYGVYGSLIKPDQIPVLISIIWLNSIALKIVEKTFTWIFCCFITLQIAMVGEIIYCVSWTNHLGEDYHMSDSTDELNKKACNVFSWQGVFKFIRIVEPLQISSDRSIPA